MIRDPVMKFIIDHQAMYSFFWGVLFGLFLGWAIQ